MKRRGSFAALWLLLGSLLCSVCTAGCEAEGRSRMEEQEIATEESFSIDSIPEYSTEPYVVIDGNEPDFDAEELTEESFESYSELDALGRCQEAYANIGQDLMPTEERGSIGRVKPTGWQTVKYDNVDGKYLYNRCHLIGYQLTAENANERNLITGTRYMNVEGMLPFENMVADYIKETGFHVLYRVTPVFKGENLLAEGVRMEAYSVEDEGEGICFHVFVYNVQPGIEIDYATGDSRLKDKGETSPGKEQVEIRGNSRSKIYHCPGQAAYEEMADSKNLVIFHSEQEAEEAGYRKAKR
ncbi:MAG: DNA/RNA non-specific endonuclease [Lachnospiraceae bacterium]